MKKILVSLSIIGIVAAIAIGGTIAYFSDVETSTGNTFTAGTLDLKVKDNDEGYKDGVTGTWKAEDAKPGDEWTFDVPFVAMWKLLGSINANHMEITSDYSVSEENPCLTSDTDCQTNLHPDKMAKEIVLTKSIYRDNSFCIDALTGKKYSMWDAYNRVCTGDLLAQSNDWKIEDKDLDGKISFSDLKSDKLDNMPVPAQGGVGETYYVMDVKFDPGAGNDLQGDTFDLTMIFTLNQDASQ